MPNIIELLKLLQEVNFKNLNSITLVELQGKSTLEAFEYITKK